MSVDGGQQDEREQVVHRERKIERGGAREARIRE